MDNNFDYNKIINDINSIDCNGDIRSELSKVGISDESIKLSVNPFTLTLKVKICLSENSNLFFSVKKGKKFDLKLRHRF